MKPVVLVLTPYYIPGVKSGGPIRSIANFADALAPDLDLRIVTSDRDECDPAPYPGIPSDCWIERGETKVRYLSPPKQTFAAWRELIASEKPDFVYVNSFFSVQFGILPVLARLAVSHRTRLVLAPRGQFSLGALGLNRWQKSVYLALTKAVGLYGGVIWHASSPDEAADIRRVFGPDVELHIGLPFSPEAPSEIRSELRREKRKGHLRVIALGRIAPMKNLIASLQFLHGLQGEIEFNVYGPVTHPDYWDQCQPHIRALPPNVRFSYHSVIENERVPEVLAQHHLMLMPTLGENFGHVIRESLAAACPVLISDRTPWHNLADARAGWDLPLEAPERFRAALQDAVNFDQEAFDRASAGALAFVRSFSDRAELIESYRRMFAFRPGA